MRGKRKFQVVFAAMLAGALTAPTVYAAEVGVLSQTELTAVESEMVIVEESERVSEVTGEELERETAAGSEEPEPETELTVGELEDGSADSQDDVSSSGQADFWVKLESTNIPELQSLQALKYAASFLNDGSQGKAAMSLGYDNDILLSGSAYIKDNSLFLTIPELTDTVFTLDLEEFVQEMMQEAAEEGTDEELPSTELFRIPAEDDGLWFMPGSTLSEIDLEALGERYMGFCGRSFEYLEDSVEIKDLPDMDFILNGSTVTCHGTRTVISGQAILRILDTSMDFVLQDSECRKIIEELAGDELDLNRDGHRLQRELYSSASQVIGDITVNEYRTPDDEQAGLYVSMYPESSEAGFTSMIFGLTNRGGETINQNFDLNCQISDGAEELLNYDVSYDTEQEGSVISSHFSGDLYVDGEKPMRFDVSGSFDEESGNYTLNAQNFENRINVETVTSYGNISWEDGQFHLNCDQITYLAKDQYVSLSAGVYGGELLSGISFDGNPAKFLDLLKAPQAALDSEAEIIEENLQKVAVKMMLHQK